TAAPASFPADRGGRSVAPMQAGAAQPAPAPALGGSSPSEPAQVAGQPAAEQTIAEPVPTTVKQAAKKPQRKTVRHNDGWGANPWRTRQSADSRGLGSFFNYR